MLKDVSDCQLWLYGWRKTEPHRVRAPENFPFGWIRVLGNMSFGVGQPCPTPCLIHVSPTDIFHKPLQLHGVNLQCQCYLHLIVWLPWSLNTESKIILIMRLSNLNFLMTENYILFGYTNISFLHFISNLTLGLYTEYWNTELRIYNYKILFGPYNITFNKGQAFLHGSISKQKDKNLEKC